MNEPLIFTTKGNVPESTLDYTQEWEDHSEYEVTLHVVDGKFKPKVINKGCMVFKEFYRDKETHELVKENRHICIFKGIDLTEEQGNLQ